MSSKRTGFVIVGVFLSLAAAYAGWLNPTQAGFIIQTFTSYESITGNNTGLIVTNGNSYQFAGDNTGYVYVGGVGSQFRGNNDGNARVDGPGAVVLGSIASLATLTNNGAGSLVLADLTPGQSAKVTAVGSASLLLGAGTVSNTQCIVVGDGNVSHGARSVTAGAVWATGAGFHGNGAGLSNLPVDLSRLAVSNASVYLTNNGSICELSYGLGVSVIETYIVSDWEGSNPQAWGTYTDGGTNAWGWRLDFSEDILISPSEEDVYYVDFQGGYAEGLQGSATGFVHVDAGLTRIASTNVFASDGYLNGQWLRDGSVSSNKLDSSVWGGIELGILSHGYQVAGMDVSATNMAVQTAGVTNLNTATLSVRSNSVFWGPVTFWTNVWADEISASSTGAASVRVTWTSGPDAGTSFVLYANLMRNGRPCYINDYYLNNGELYVNGPYLLWYNGLYRFNAYNGLDILKIDSDPDAPYGEYRRDYQGISYRASIAYSGPLPILVNGLPEGTLKASIHSIAIEEMRTNLTSAAIAAAGGLTNAGSFATATQGAKADAAVTNVLLNGTNYPAASGTVSLPTIAGPPGPAGTNIVGGSTVNPYQAYFIKALGNGPATAGATQVVNLANGAYQTYTVTNTPLTFLLTTNNLSATNAVAFWLQVTHAADSVSYTARLSTATFLLPGGVQPVFSQDTNNVDVLDFVWNGSKAVLMNHRRDLR